MSLLFAISLAFIAVLIPVQGASSKCPGFESPIGPEPLSPKIKFSSVPMSHYDGTINITDSEILINTTKVIEVNLDCWASYPIDMTFSGHLTNQRIKEVRTQVNSYTTMGGGKAHCYHINVSLTSYKEITGNYSCYDVSIPSRASSKYVYVYNPPRPGILLRNGETVTVVAKHGQKFIILPCAISNPELKSEVQLQKMSPNDPQWILPSGSLKYDPQIGFVMSLDLLDKSYLGNYECRTEATDIVKIRLVEPKEWGVNPSSKRIDIKRGDQLILECFSTQEIMIRTNPQIPHSDLPTTSGSEYKYIKIFRSNIINEAIQGSAECVRVSDNVTLHQWRFDVSSEMKKEDVLDVKRVVNSCRNPINGTEIVLYECDNWVQCRMSQCIRNDASCQSNNYCVKKLCIPNGIIQCPTPNDGVVSEIFFTGFNDVRYTNWKHASHKDILRMNKSMDSSNNANLVCEGTNFVLAAGFQWIIIYENGSFSVLNSEILGHDMGIKDTWGRTKSTIVSTLSFSKKFRMTGLPGVKLIICSAPVWNSTEWINQTMRMDEMMIFIRSNEPSGNHACSLSRSTEVIVVIISIYTIFCNTPFF